MGYIRSAKHSIFFCIDYILPSTYVHYDVLLHTGCRNKAAREAKTGSSCITHVAALPYQFSSSETTYKV